MPHVVQPPGLFAGARIAGLLAAVHAVNDVLATVGALLPSLRNTFVGSDVQDRTDPLTEGASR